jgi:hypothetical protein
VPEVTSLIGRVCSECARIMDYRERYEAGDGTYGIASVREGLLHARSFAPEIADRALQSIV